MIDKRIKQPGFGPFTMVREDRRGSRKAIILVGAFSLVATIYFFNYLDRASAQETSSCVVCHSGLESRLSEPVKLFEHDIHKSKDGDIFYCGRACGSKPASVNVGDSGHILTAQ